MTKLLEKAFAEASRLPDPEQDRLAESILEILEDLEDAFEDQLELKNPEVRDHIRESYREYLSGKSRSAEEFLAELEAEGEGKSKATQHSDS